MKALQWVGPLVILLAWGLASWLELFSPTLLPGLVDTLKHFGRMIYNGSILGDFVESILRMGVGYLLAVLIGVPGGVLIGYFTSLYKAFEIPLDFFRSLPVTTLYPLFVLIFGIGHNSKIAMVVVACVFVIMLNTAYGVMQRKRVRSQVALLFGASRLQLLREILFWEALPQTLIGMRIAISYALIVEIVCEMFMGTQKGLGQRVFEAYNTYFIVELYAIILLVGLTGYLINKLFVFFESRAVHWVGN